MKRNKLLQAYCLFMFFVITMILRADFSFIEWSSETQYHERVQYIFNKAGQDRAIHPYILEESLAEVLHDRGFRNADNKSAVVHRLLDQFLKNNHFNGFIQHFFRRFSDLEKELQKEYLKKAILLNRENVQAETLEKDLLSLYKENFGKDSWLENILNQKVSFSPEATWVWTNYNYAGYPFKNLNFPMYCKDSSPISFKNIKGEINIDPHTPLFDISLDFYFDSKQAGVLSFKLSQKTQNLAIHNGEQSLEYFRHGEDIEITLPDEGIYSISISYQIHDYCKDNISYLGQVFGFLNPHSRLLPQFSWPVSSSLELTLSGVGGLSLYLPEQKKVVLYEEKEYTYQSDKMDYDKFFIAYTPDGHLRKRSFSVGGNEVDVLCYSPVASHTVRVQNVMQRMNLSHDPLLLVMLPAVDTHLYYPGLAVINDRHVRGPGFTFYLHFAHAVFQGELMSSRVREEDIVLLAGFIENTSLKVTELLARNEIRQARKQLQELYNSYHAAIDKDSLANIVFEGNTFFNYLCGKDYTNNRAVYNHFRRSSEKNFISATEDYFRTEQRNPWQQMKESWDTNSYLPQIILGRPVFIIWSNLKQELRVLVSKQDITFPIPVDLQIVTHDEDELYKHFVVHRISSLFVFPTVREVMRVALDPHDYYLKHPDFREHVKVEITPDMYEERPASGMFR